MKRYMILLAMLCVGQQSVQAGAFQIGEMATRSTGMGSAFTAVADDASAAWHNPAGVAFTEGTQVMVGGAVIVVPGALYTPNASTGSVAGLGFPAPAATKSASKTFVVPHTYLTYWDQQGQYGLSLSVNAPFGLETEWATSSSLAASSTLSRISLLMTSPSVVVKMSDHVSASAGFSYVYLNKVNLNNSIQHLEGTNSDGWGGNASVMYKDDSISVGATYRSRVKMKINGVVTGAADIVNLAGLLLPTPLAGLIPALPGLVGTTTAATTSITLPDQLNVGVAWNITPDFLLSLDANWTNWKTFDQIRIDYAPSTLSTVLTSGTGVKILPQNYKATTTFRVGTEWKFNPKMRFRLGYVFDPTPVNSTDFSNAIPDNDRQIFSTGYTYKITPKTSFDFAYAFVLFKDRNQTGSAGGLDVVRNGNYSSNAHILGASLNHQF